MTNIRIGQGVDVHQWEEGKSLVLGGVPVPHHSGLKGHSDGDALLHALIDALCGATGRGDIGEFFPDTDPIWKNADSKDLTTKIVRGLHVDGWRIINVDTTIIAEEPMIAPYKKAMQNAIGELLSLSPEQVGVKATTCEKLGFLGRREGLMVMAVALVEKIS